MEMKAMYKRLLMLLVALMLLVSVMGITAFAEQLEVTEDPVCYEHGDVNGDGDIDSRDAIRTLFYALWGESISVNQDCDFNGDKDVTQKDAIYLLYVSLDMYERKGTIHNYYDPIWTWDTTGTTPTAQVSLKCACGQPHTVTDPTVTAGTVKEPTCVAAGYREYTAKVTCDGTEFENTVTVTVPATGENGHVMEGTQNCETASTCTSCGYELPALGHDWELNEEKSTAATCAKQAVQWYDCSVCGESKTVELEGTLSCSYKYYQDVLVEGETCKYVKQYKCSVCSDVMNGTAQSDTYDKHSYTVTLTKEATCSEAGVKTYTCDDCADSYTEAVPANDSHAWDTGVTANGVTTYTCGDCAVTKTAVSVSGNEAVSKETLEETQELQLEEGAAISLDSNTVNGLEDAIQISVTVVDVENTDLSETEKEQVGDNTVYDFSMTYASGEAVSQFNGVVTVSLPYELSEGEDIDSIDVWFIADDGTPTQVFGTYSNGFVTFTTTHFSYYTVTRLTPAQRCARYGHIRVDSQKAASCLEDGYSMSVCQRCGVQLEKTVVPMTGHSYKDTENAKAPTCAEAGYSEQKCELCGDIQKGELPKRGHSYEENKDKSVAATCDAPGKKVSVCKHCKGEQTEDIKQLEHAYERTETVEADCTSKGHDKHTCKRCKAEKIDNEKEAKGHNWQVAENGWQWAEDHSKATVTLVCSHKNTHTKVLTAVITKNLNGTVCTGGEAAYTATASFNKVTYTDTVTATQTGVGHTPGSKMESNDSQHYYLCTVCGDQVGAAGHNWVRTVNTAATCAKAGSATDQCSVCDKEKQVVLPATGAHSYENGVCSGCGKSDGSCDHKRLTKTEIDLSEYGVCGGWATVVSCDCGQVSYLYDWSLVCDREQTSKDDDVLYVSVCTDCGFTFTRSDALQTDREACTGQWVESIQFLMGDTVIVDSQRAYYSFSHPVVVEHTPVKLADYGLCGGTLISEGCYCGERSSWHLDESDTTGCTWVYDEAAGKYTCSVCGTVRTSAGESGEEGCQWIEEHTTTYSRNGQAVYSYTERYVYDNHTYKTTSWELYGESCEDGVYIERTCSGCGKIEGNYYDECVSCVEQEVIDTTGVGFCSDAIVLEACPCGAATSYYFRYADDAQQYHSWGHDGDENVLGCMYCGYTQTREFTYGEKDENCCRDVRTQYTFFDDAGHSFTFATCQWELRHEYEDTFVLEGDSCEDGVEITETCSDCGYSYSWTTTGHQTYEVEVLDLTAYGYCGQTATQYACPCGYQSYISVGSGSGCSWSWIGGGVLESGGQYHVQQCTVCGITWRQESVPGESDDPCKLVYHHTYTFLKDNETLGSISYDSVEENHRYVYELELNEGAADCTGGYSYTATCLTCGKTETRSGSGHASYPVTRQIISTEDMCGQLEFRTNRCACGENSYTWITWLSDAQSCSFSGEMGEYSDTYGGWREVCTVCGASRVVVNEYNKVEGTTCQEELLIRYIYLDPQGNEIGRYETSNIMYQHTWLYTHTLLGESCDDGWTYSLVCADCGETETYTDTYYGCELHAVSREVVYDSEDICAPVYLYRRACACGAEEVYEVRYSCQGSWEGKYFTCSTCGLQQTNSYSYDRISGTCRATVTMEYTFLLGGETVATVEKTFEQTDHIWVHTFQLNGEACTDGYTVNMKCAFCDESESRSETYYNHSVWRTEYYELPEGSCEGQVEVVSCACGQGRQVNYSHKNSFYGNGREETDENGVIHHYSDMECYECGMTMNEEWYDVAGADACHPVRHMHNTWKLGDWELTLSGERAMEDHDYETLSVALREGSVSCSDGVTGLRRCKVCGYEYTYTTHSHEKAAAGSIDLAQYGSVCGAKLNLMKCACGADQGYEFSEDTLCDLDEKSTDQWIEGALSDNCYTTEGWQNIWSDSYLYTCAVTDPACAMQIRMSRYWLNENCTAVQYETWQLGYDADTGTCQQEITVATGQTRTYHPYAQSAVNETVDGQSVSGTKYTCPDCGSYYSELSYYNDEGVQAKFLRETVNTLDNGESQKLTQTWERVYYNGCQYTSVQRYEQERADGSTYWFQYAYTYDFTDGCKRDWVYTNSDGESNSDTGEAAHITSWSIEWIKNSTCTQWGRYVERWTCNVCGEVESEYFYDAEPTAHSWSWDSELETYVCGSCGLENANAASGSIVMEDLTANYTDGNYVIGYWNRGEVEFNPYVSLVLYDAAEDENDELVLTGIDFTYLTVANDGICGLTFSQEAVATAAAAAIEEAGYTGTYAVRISFVPIGSTDTLDYAITFETLTAE